MLYDDAGDYYVPDASDTDTREALRFGLEALEEAANAGPLGFERLELFAEATVFFQAAADGIAADLGLIP